MTTTVPLEVLLGGWVAAGLTLFIFSFLYKDNPLFKLAEHLYVGVSLGYVIVKSYELVFRLVINPIADEGEWLRLIPVGIGTLMLARYVPKIAWLSRIAFAFVVGFGSGVAIPRIISSFVLKQVEDTVRPLVSVVEGGALRPTFDLLDPNSSLNSVVILIGVVSVLFYFFFSIEHRGPGRVVARTGIVFQQARIGGIVPAGDGAMQPAHLGCTHRLMCSPRSKIPFGSISDRSSSNHRKAPNPLQK